MAERYNYLMAVTEDVKEWIEDNMDLEHDIMTGTFEDLDDIREYLNDTLWTEDSITGNASGSYYCNTWEAEEALAHNLDLIEEVAEQFGCTPEIRSGYEYGAEWWDVTIRCYYLYQAIDAALEEIEEDIEAAIEARNNEPEDLEEYNNIA